MNFDYDLIEKIGATHYLYNNLYKVDSLCAFIYNEASCEWVNATFSASQLALNAIPPRPQHEYEYELVTDKDFWELREEFSERALFNGKHECINTLEQLVGSYKNNRVYRRKTIERDWRDDVISNTWSDTVEKVSHKYLGIKGDFNRGDAIKLARAILKATGESL